MKHGLKSISTVAASTHSPIESRMVLVTPEAATRWLEKSLWNKQRKYRAWHGEELAETMRRKEFMEGTQIHFAKLDGVVHLVNGQHTLNGIKLYGQPVSLNVLTTTVATEKNIAELYSRHDRHVRRTDSDAYEAHGLAEKHGLSEAQVNKLGSGVRAIICGFDQAGGGNSGSYDTRSADVRMRHIDEYGAAGLEYFKCIKQCPAFAMKELRVASVVGVALVTFKQSPEKASEFWSQVAFSNGLVTGDPRKTLMDWLVANNIRRTVPAARARVVARAWNTFLVGGTASRFNMPDWTKPIVINVA